ncbi:MAG TPA: C40 family peptidase [Gaiellaceae bacterium]|nr:C40 family peptidase [Gaiellaceae bacterium]
MLALPAIAAACAIAVLVALPGRGAGEPTRVTKHPRPKVAKHKAKHKHKAKPKRHHRKHRVHKPSLGERAARIALKAVGIPYRWGGASPAGGFDCSGLVYWAYGRLGINLPHSSYALYGRGRSVSRSRMKPGDLVFFSGLGHVGMYIGRGRMVHAPHSGSRVQVVPLGGPYYGGRLVGARRIA